MAEETESRERTPKDDILWALIPGEAPAIARQALQLGGNFNLTGNTFYLSHYISLKVSRDRSGSF